VSTAVIEGMKTSARAGNIHLGSGDVKDMHPAYTDIL
jgi:hypothetical protein